MVGRVGLPFARPDVVPPSGLFQSRRPRLEITRHGSKGRIGEQVDAAFETSGGDAILDRGDQTVASRGVVDLSQARRFHRDGAVRPLAHVSRRGPIDVAEQRKHQGAEYSYPDQRQLERRRP